MTDDAAVTPDALTVAALATLARAFGPHRVKHAQVTQVLDNVKITRYCQGVLRVEAEMEE